MLNYQHCRHQCWNLPTEIAIRYQLEGNSKANALCEKAIHSVGLDWLQPSKLITTFLFIHMMVLKPKKKFFGFKYVIIEEKFEICTGKF